MDTNQSLCSRPIQQMSSALSYLSLTRFLSPDTVHTSTYDQVTLCTTKTTMVYTMLSHTSVLYRMKLTVDMGNSFTRFHTFDIPHRSEQLFDALLLNRQVFFSNNSSISDLFRRYTLTFIQLHKFYFHATDGNISL